MPGVRVQGGAEARGLRRAGDGFAIGLSDGRTIEAPICALATPAPEAAALVERDWPAVAGALRRIGTSTTETLGVVLPRERPVPPKVAFLVATDDPRRAVGSRVQRLPRSCSSRRTAKPGFRLSAEA